MERMARIYLAGCLFGFVSGSIVGFIVACLLAGFPA